MFELASQLFKSTGNRSLMAVAGVLFSLCALAKAKPNTILAIRLFRVQTFHESI